MNRLALAIMMLAIMVRPVSAQTSYRVAPDFRIPRVIGGEVNSDGTVALGKGFTTSLVAPGEYEVAFQRRLFTGCPVMTVTPVGSQDNVATGEIKQSSCSNVFYIYFYLPGGTLLVDNTFQFVAVGASR